METRTLLAWLAEVLAAETADSAETQQNRDRISAERCDFTPSPEEIRAATRSIQAEWSEEEWRKRAGTVSRARGWRVPRVRAVIVHDDDRCHDEVMRRYKP